MSDKKKVNKVLNVIDILVIAFGAMIGWGWVVSSGSWIQTGGVVGTVLGFIFGGTMIFFVGLTYAELTPAFPKKGGEQLFSYKAFGPTGSFICTWILILSYVGVVCYETCSLPTILQYIFPDLLQGYMYTIAGFDVYATWVIIGAVFSILLIILNIIGIKKSAIFQKIFTFIIAVVGLSLFAASLFSGNSNNFNSQLFVGDGFNNVFGNILKITIITPFFFFGFDVIPQVSEEINIKPKKIGWAMLLSIVLAVTFYSLVVIGIGRVFNKDEIAASISNSGLVTAEAMAKAFNSSVLAKVMIIAGLCGIVTSWNSFLIGGSRAIYSMSESYMIPRRLSRINTRFKTPDTALVMVGIISIIALFFGRTVLVWIVNASSLACCFAYCFVALSFLVIRKKHPNIERPFKIKHYKIVGIIAVILSASICMLYLIPGTGYTLVWQEWIVVGLWILLGIIFYIWSRIKYKDLFAINIDSSDC